LAGRIFSAGGLVEVRSSEGDFQPRSNFVLVRKPHRTLLVRKKPR